MQALTEVQRSLLAKDSSEQVKCSSSSLKFLVPLGIQADNDHCLHLLRDYCMPRELSDFPVVQTVKNLPAMQETWVRPLGWEDPLEKGMATHSSLLAWKIPWTEEPGGLQSEGSQSDSTERPPPPPPLLLYAKYYAKNLFLLSHLILTTVL